MNFKDIPQKEFIEIKTLGELKRAGYQPKSVKQELRDNLIVKLKNREKSFDGIWGYDETVIPELERAILSMHNIILLGLRGQAKTKIARLMIDLLDDFIPVIADSELNDDWMKTLPGYDDEVEIHEEIASPRFASIKG